MKFIFGLAVGLVLGAVGAVAYSIQSGRDLREAFDEVRSDLGRGDLDALGARLEARVTEMQTQLEARIGEIRERATAAVGATADTSGVAVDISTPEAAEAKAAAEAAAAVAADAETMATTAADEARA